MLDFGYGVKLGPVDTGHLGMMREWRNHESVRKWCRQYTLISDQDQREWFERQRNDKTIQMFMVLDVESNPVGVAGLTSIDYVNRRAEFSLYIAPRQQQKGLGERALKTLLAFGFRHLNLSVIWGECFQGNPAMALFNKVGFRVEGLRRAFYFRDGQSIGAHLVSILDEEWRQRYFSSPQPSLA